MSEMDGDYPRKVLLGLHYRESLLCRVGRGKSSSPSILMLL